MIGLLQGVSGSEYCLRLFSSQSHAGKSGYSYHALLYVPCIVIIAQMLELSLLYLLFLAKQPNFGR